MNKWLSILGFLAILACAYSAVTCPDEDENSQATYYPHETDCGKFYECHYGQALELHCPSGLYWDTRLNVCNRDVDCGTLSTSTSSPTAASV